ncbi:MAG: hypothetical protein VX670_10995, partial [Candidatus Latescibacterota bacterium]|nr:hypothetical protein [Candidatus Latescibacterota bacterium]
MLRTALRPTPCTSAAAARALLSSSAAALDPAASGLLSIRERLRRTPVEPRVLQLIDEESLGRRKSRRGQRWRLVSEAGQRAGEEAAGGLFGAIHGLGDFCVGQTRHAREQDHLPLRLLEAVERG